jgi:prophage regulatory protein
MERLLTREEVERLTGFKRSAIYERVAAGTFPKPRRERGTGTVRWLESELQSWIAAWIASSEEGGAFEGSRAATAKQRSGVGSNGGRKSRDTKKAALSAA